MNRFRVADYGSLIVLEYTGRRTHRVSCYMTEQASIFSLAISKRYQMSGAKGIGTASRCH